jgi:hypothetical protein
MTLPRRYRLVLAIYINSRGFAFVIFEGHMAPLDWSAVEVRGKDKQERTIRRASSLLSRYMPDVLVLQDMTERGTRRTHRIRRLNDDIAERAEDFCIPVASFSRDQVREGFRHLGAITKDTIAAEIARNIPAFERFLPPRRKIWESEDARMGIFDAAALALTFFQSKTYKT